MKHFLTELGIILLGLLIGSVIACCMAGSFLMIARLCR